MPGILLSYGSSPIASIPGGKKNQESLRTNWAFTENQPLSRVKGISELKNKQEEKTSFQIKCKLHLSFGLNSQNFTVI